MRTPKHVLQLYQNVVRYGKDQHNAAARREMGRWHEVILSRSGFVEGDRVVLSEEAARPPGLFANGNLLILNDYNGGDSSAAMNWTHPHLTISAAEAVGLAPYGIFGLREGSGEALEVHLRYGGSDGWIGEPRRGDYKLADLRVGEPVRVIINGKRDFSLTAGMARRYLMAEFILEYLGEFSTFVVRTDVNVAKAPPVDRARVVDLTRILY